MFHTLDYNNEGPLLKVESAHQQPASGDDANAPAAQGSAGGSRRPGNLWTAEAREDMFRRREAGETWETICLDYPKRSRHAMQQQYSMMKKQKAIANGTWTTNRRGRKRRNPAPENGQTPAKRSSAWDGDDDGSDDEGYSEMGSEDVEDQDGGDVSMRDDSASSGRPNQLLRSATEPMKPSKQQTVSLPAQKPLHSSLANGPRSSMEDSSGLSVSKKRKRFSPDPSAAPKQSLLPNVPPSFIPPSIMLDKEDLIQLLNKGIERANQNNLALDQEKSSQRQAFESAVSRANRRVSEVQDKLTYANFEHGDSMKMARAEFAETLKTKTREHAESMEKLTNTFERQYQNQNRKMEALQRIADLLSSELKAAKGEDAALEKQIQDIKEEANITSRIETTPSSSKEVLESVLAENNRAQVAAQADATAKTATLQAVEKSVSASFAGLSGDFDKLSNMIQSLNANVEDMPHKVTLRSIKEINDQNAAAAHWLKECSASLDGLTRSTSSPSVPPPQVLPPPPAETPTRAPPPPATRLLPESMDVNTPAAAPPHHQTISTPTSVPSEVTSAPHSSRLELPPPQPHTPHNMDYGHKPHHGAAESHSVPTPPAEPLPSAAHMLSEPATSHHHHQPPSSLPPPPPPPQPSPSQLTSASMENKPVTPPKQTSPMDPPASAVNYPSLPSIRTGPPEPAGQGS